MQGKQLRPCLFHQVKDCNADDAIKANLLFKGGTVGNYLSNKTGDGKATNVGIQIVKADGTGTPIKVDGSEANREKAPDTGKEKTARLFNPVLTTLHVITPQVQPPQATLKPLQLLKCSITKIFIIQ